MSNFINSLKQFVNQNLFLTGFFVGWVFVYTGLHSVVWELGEEAYYQVESEVTPERTMLEIINPFDGK